MRSFLASLWKAFFLFTLWAFIGASLYSVAHTIFAGTGSLKNSLTFNSPKVPLQFPAIQERTIEGVAVRYAATQHPVDLEFDPDGTGYVLDDTGLIFRVKVEGERDSVPYAILRSEKTEKSVPFVAMALHPGFLDSESRGFGRFYAIEPELARAGDPDFRPQYDGGQLEHHQDVLYEYRTTDPRTRLFTGSKREILRLSQPGPEHNMNDLAFDRTGRLFIAIGDGAKCEPGRDQPSRNAMSLSNPYGKVLRIDPLGNTSRNGNYAIPRRNPFSIIDGAIHEIWCYGLRDPRRIDFDPFRDWLSIVDIGQDDIEEVNVSEIGGEHFGWDLCEGSYFYPPEEGDKATDGVEGPRAEFARKGESTVSGGFVYRGESFPGLRGRLVFADRSGRLMAARTDGSGSIERLLVGNQRALSNEDIATVRPGRMGELFILTTEGNIYELQKRTTASRKVRKSRRPMMAWVAPF